MVKRIIAGIAAICAIPIMAHAWTLNTWVKTGGGNIAVRDGDRQTSVNGSVFKSYTTSSGNPNNSFNVVVQANNGYTIGKVTVNGNEFSAPSSPYSVTVAGPFSQSVWATFKPQALSVSASAGSGGVVSPTVISNIRYGQVVQVPVRFRVAPATGFRVVSIDGVPSGATISQPLPAPLEKAVVVTLPRGFVFNSAISLSASFSGASANAGVPQTVTPGTVVTLDGSGSVGATSFSWTQTSGPGFPAIKAIPDGTSGAQVSFVAASVGSYNFRLTINGGATAYATVTVTTSAVKTVRTQCQNCHQTNLIGTKVNVFNKWSSSLHKVNFVMCAKCHIGVDTGSHPGPSLTSATLLNACLGCHIGPSGSVANHPVSTGAALCVSCHDPHSTQGSMGGVPAVHFNNMTAAGYPASYMTSRSSCADCHVDNTANAVVRTQWAQSGHAATKDDAWMRYDFKTRSGCVQCHTTTGFIAYSTGKAKAAWGVTSDKTKELLSCKGCHSDISTGAVRSLAPVHPFADDTYLNHDLGKSNVCMGCHSGSNNGSSIKTQLGRVQFENVPFIAPHHLSAGGTMQGENGYHFLGQSYSFYSSNTHRMLGVANINASGYSGPCVACHMSSSEKHLYQAVKLDSNGGISSITVTFCANCHSASMNAASLQAKRDAYLASLDVLRAMLADKGFAPSTDAPYFSNTNWGSGQTGADVMGAAFNYQMLLSEPGAYAHNAAYAKKLIVDSIDLLYNGSVTGSIDSALIYLVQKGAITQGAANSLTSYANNSCTSCHGGTTASGNPMASNGHSIHLSANYGPGSYLGSTMSSCQTCHIYGAATHANGSVDLVNNGCLGCHPAGAPDWSDGTRVACTSCHAATASTLPNGVAAPNQPYFVGKGHGKYPVSSDCTVCHDPSAPHISGSLGSYKRLVRNDNNLCALCHNDSSKVGAQYLNMVTHNGLTCATCHDPHGSANLSMIRSTINGSPITYNNATYGLIDTTTERGLCQVCHTSTNHYRAGVPENNHFTSGCLNCHLHNAPSGAFTPSGGGSCDSCHGYPPAPKNTMVSFGTESNWANARFEDYSGGGGGHLVAAHISPFAKPTEGWSNCTVCHNGGRLDSTPYHQMVTPVKSHIDNVHVEVDSLYRFSKRFMVYTGARQLNAPAVNKTGRCFNISCHMTPSRRWGTER